ncbi:hypothetical protein ABGF48_07850 [Helcococcus bovis]|uniref:hypothetical protein n=1 Tax=Helcococcus bovis TaxID=3153252 RepID=UPI0038BD0B78
MKYLCLICYYLIEIFNISGKIMAKALILIDYCNDFIADNGKLTIGKRVQEIEGSITDLAKESYKRGDYVFSFLTLIN